jgi:hypothetical protein
MRYKVNAYIRTNFAYLADSFETDDFYEVQDAIEGYCQQGYDCQLIDNERNTEGWCYAEQYADDFYENLRMEQCEQM